MFLKEFNGAVNLRYKLDAQASAPLLIPLCRFEELAKRGSSKGNGEPHLLRRSVINVLTSLHDTTSSGFAS
jgi:hypothetical protein